jgi:hypothetical protein
MVIFNPPLNSGIVSKILQGLFLQKHACGLYIIGELGSSVIIMSDYRLHDLGSFPAEANDL